MPDTTFSIDLNHGTRSVPASNGKALQVALNEAGVYLPSACGGRGICGKCRITVLSGAPEPNSVEKHHISPSDLAKGERLACQIRVSSDLVVDIPETVLKARPFNATVESKKRLTHDILELTLKVDGEETVSERPGQYIRLEVPAEGGPVHRAYSISSTEARKGMVELVVRLVPDGLGSLYVHRIQPGERVTFTGPYGNFRMNEDPDVEVICVGGGSGMSAVKNVIHSIYDRWSDRRCRLFFGCRSQRDIFYLDEFRALAAEHPSFSYTYALSEPDESQPWEGPVGFIHLVMEKELEDDGPKRQAFLCGPPPMIDAALAVLRKKGLSEEDIYFDAF